MKLAVGLMARVFGDIICGIKRDIVLDRFLYIVKIHGTSETIVRLFYIKVIFMIMRGYKD